MDPTREEQVMKVTVAAIVSVLLFAVAPQVAAGGNVAQIKAQVVPQIATVKRAQAARATVQRADIQRAVVERADAARVVVKRADTQRAHAARISITRLLR